MALIVSWSFMCDCIGVAKVYVDSIHNHIVLYLRLLINGPQMGLFSNMSATSSSVFLPWTSKHCGALALAPCPRMRRRPDRTLWLRSVVAPSPACWKSMVRFTGNRGRCQTMHCLHLGLCTIRCVDCIRGRRSVCSACKGSPRRNLYVVSSVLFFISVFQFVPSLVHTKSSFS
jgi:hypothetical protein